MTQNRKPISSQSLFQLQVSLSHRVKSQKYCKQYSSLDPVHLAKCVFRGTEVYFFHTWKVPFRLKSNGMEFLSGLKKMLVIKMTVLIITRFIPWRKFEACDFCSLHSQTLLQAMHYEQEIFLVFWSNSSLDVKSSLQFTWLENPI